MPNRIGVRIATFGFLFWGAMIWWHWEAMLVSYLSTRVISLPFNNIPELIRNTPFRILFIPGTSFEDSFRYSKDPDWMYAFENRIEEHLEEHQGLGRGDFLEILKVDAVSAYYDNYFSIM